jgi:NTP pyrophosphatase (non-canonical NTP hydrolase)
MKTVGDAMFSDNALRAAVEFANKVGGYGGGKPPTDADIAQAKELANSYEPKNRWERIICDVLRGQYPIYRFDEYELAALSLAFYPGRGTHDLTYPILGLVGESGEVADHFKKALRDDGRMTPERKEAIAKELGDVLWYIGACAQELGLTINDIASMNIAKLYDRARRGKLGGDGDAR